MKNRAWFLLFACAALLCAGAWIAMPAKTTGHVVEIYQDGKLLYTIDLDSVSAPYDMVLEGDALCNTIHITQGDICITDATCPDQVCVHRGWLSQQTTPIVCLPNRILIQYQDSVSEDVDAVTGAVP